MKDEEVKVKVNAEEPKSEKSADRKDAEKAKKPTAKELEQQVIFLTKQAADAQKKQGKRKTRQSPRKSSCRPPCPSTYGCRRISTISAAARKTTKPKRQTPTRRKR